VNGNTVLLVDDSKLISGMVGEALQEAGFELLLAGDGYEAIEACYRLLPDIVVMDIDMPLLKGYQASRLLKTRRGVRDIPIIMHTSNSDDKDRFWSYNSGACAFVVKDFENIGPLIETVRKHIAHDEPDLKAIAEDARGLTRETIASALAEHLDKALFRSTVINQLSDAGKSIASLAGTARRVLELSDLASERQVAAIVIKSGREILSFVFPSARVNKEMAEDFLAVAMADFQNLFPRESLTVADTVYFNIDSRADWTKVSLEKDRLSSYLKTPLAGASGEVIGSLHLAHFQNNHFSASIEEDVAHFAATAGIIIHNSLLYGQVATMEEEIRSVFSKFVPREIINDLVARKSRTSMLAGQKRELAILFSDIRSFTTLSESNPPEDVVSFLNRYLETMCEHIARHGGTVDKFIGDAVLAVFGAPTSWPDNALRAIRTALAMSRALKTFDTKNINLPPGGFEIGIGIHLGEAIVGTIGSSTKFDYTVIGDTVNLASRLEGLTKHYRTRIIASESVLREIRAQRQDAEGIEFREIEEVVVMGKAKPTLLYSVTDDQERLFDENEASLYKKGLSMYRLRNWKTATDYFGEVLRTKPDDPISGMYFERCRKFQDSPPPDSWDLVERQLTK
jgi:class 3 adenylate cyclase/CheY-like chemotaxis protein